MANGYLDAQYEKHMGMLSKMISDSSVMDPRLIRDLQGLSKKALVSLAKHSNIVERIRDAYEYEKKHDFSQLTLEGGSQNYGTASEPVRAIVHAYAEADANRAK